MEQFKRKEIKLGDFIINGAYKIEKEIYNSLSDNYSKQNKINTKNLHGSPEKCPYCNNNIAFVYCDRCDNISCGSINESWQCTWCGLEGIIGIAENLKVSRTRG